MFTGIIEGLAEVQSVEKNGSNVDFWLASPIVPELHIDQSVAHDGVCLTVVEIHDGAYRVTAIQETLLRTNLGHWKKGDQVNFERCMPAHGRFDGHIVQGHVDVRAIVKHIEDINGSWNVHIRLKDPHGGLIVEKGSICVNGVSLTVASQHPHGFHVSIIPYTFENTTFHRLKKGDTVNIEFDILGKYVQAMHQRGA